MADVATKQITRLLIANRGEIARRIIRTAHEMGITTVAIYADSDASAIFVREADQAIALKGKTSAETYLNVTKVLDACRRTDADAVHPGYGFLAENSEFAKAVTAAGMVWVGPSVKAISAMADKISAKRLMKEADVPTLPAHELGTDDDIFTAAKEIGYPVLVKASAGGGGRGMRVVKTKEELTEAVDSARREASAAFGDDTLFLERWLTASRHVEIQILGDLHGNLVHLFERECSIQRRHQKIIEEAPSPAVKPEIRARMGEAALSVARNLDYASAGTVEFLLDGEEFWFLEVNTRLQVEHPVTEEITGLDLVREQLRIAAGEELGYNQDDLSVDGHAIEARIYAEDPVNNFLPSPGTVVVWEPDLTTGARFEAGIETGSVISPEFDPMIAKVIVKARDRQEAARRLARVLGNTRLQGITNNRDFLVSTLQSPEFIAGDTTTDFIERVNPSRSQQMAPMDIHHSAIAAVIAAQAQRRAQTRVLGTLPSGWRNSKMPPERVTFRQGEIEFIVAYRAQRNGNFEVSIGGDDYAVAVFSVDDAGVDLEINRRRFSASITQAGENWLIHGAHGEIELKELPRFPDSTQADFTGGLVAPMPGKVTTTHVEEGATVVEGQLLLILEAMKMEHRITAPVSGMVKQMRVSVGDQVNNGELLVVLEEVE